MRLQRFACNDIDVVMRVLLKQVQLASSLICDSSMTEVE
jgi:hypothetical protein